MFVLTTKFDKRKITLALAVIAIVAVAIIIISLFSGGDAAESVSMDAVVKSNEQRVTYLNSLGWEVEEDPLEEQTVIIPQEFGDVYAEYCRLQTEQGFDLSKYAGLEATRYTYKVLNYPSGEDVVADMIVYRNKVIAGDVQSTALDGFMAGLMPAAK